MDWLGTTKPAGSAGKGKKEAFMFRGWVKLMEAVIGLAERDAKGRGGNAEDARWFLKSDWCEEMRDVCRSWRADCDKSNRMV